MTVFVGSPISEVGLNSPNKRLLLAASLTLKEAFRIPDTAERGITREQLAEVVRFISRMADRCCETFGGNRGRKLKFEDFNLYHADYWLIKPATQGYRDKGCSLVEVMALRAQRPHWFVSHAWIEPWLKKEVYIRYT